MRHAHFQADGPAAPAAGNRPNIPTQVTPATGSPAGFPTVVRRCPSVIVDREEITVIGTPDTNPRATTLPNEALPQGASPASAKRPPAERMRLPTKPRPATGGRSRGGSRSATNSRRILFTHIAVPVMTRLKPTGRQVLDTLVDAGVARSRVRRSGLVGQTRGCPRRRMAGQTALGDGEVDDLRAEGPALGGASRLVALRRGLSVGTDNL